MHRGGLLGRWVAHRRDSYLFGYLDYRCQTKSQCLRQQRQQKIENRKPAGRSLGLRACGGVGRTETIGSGNCRL